MLAACAGPRAPAPISEEEQGAYDAAIAARAPTEIEAKLREFLNTRPQSPLADDAMEQLAQLALRLGHREDAMSWLGMLIRQYPDGDRFDAASLRLARFEYERGNVERARSLAVEIDPARLTAGEQRTLYRLRVEVAERGLERLRYLTTLRELAASELEAIAPAEEESAVAARLTARVKDLDGEIDGLIVGMSDEDLRRAVRALRDRVPAGRIRILLAQRALMAGENAAAESEIEAARRLALTPNDLERIESLEARLGLLGATGSGGLFLPTFRELASLPRPRVEGASGVIGVVLPLSGQGAPFGEQSLRGILLAAGIFDPDGPPVEPTQRSSRAAAGKPARLTGGGDDLDFQLSTGEGGLLLGSGLRLIVRDSAGDAERAASAVRELAGSPDVVAIVGPIFSRECEAAAREAETGGLPLLLLSNREEISRERQNVFRLRTTPSDEVGFLVDHAVDVLGARNFAVLYPKSRYGLGMRKEYWDAVRRRGGRMVAVASYEPDSTDFSESIRQMIGYSLLTKNEKIALQERDAALRRGRRLEPENQALLRDITYPMLGPEYDVLPPIVDFDAIFIPDSYEKIQLIAPQLAYHEVSNVQLLGSSDWNHPDLFRIAGKHVRGAVISTPFYKDSEYDFVRDYVSAYREEFDEEPDMFSAYAFDATNLVLAQLAAGRNSRAEVREGILRVRGYPGVSGVISVLPDGNASKRPFLLGVRRGRTYGLD